VDEGTVEAGAVVRLSGFARAALESQAREAGARVEAPAVDAERLAPGRYTFGPQSDVAAIVEAARAGEVFSDGERVGLALRPELISRAAERDPGLLGLRVAFGALLGAIPDELDALLEAGLARLPVCGFTAAAGFVAIEDPGLRRALYEDATAKLFWAGPPLADGLLVRAGVTMGALEAVLSRHGVRFHALGR